MRFPVLFLLWLAALSVATQLPWTLAALRAPLCAAIAQATALAFRLVGVELTVSGALLTSPHGAVRIVPECDGVALLVFFVAAVLALPKPPVRVWLAPALVGGIALFAANFARVIALTATQLFWRDAFEFVHFYLLQGLMIVATTLVWLAWADRTLRARATAL